MNVLEGGEELAKPRVATGAFAVAPDAAFLTQLILTLNAASCEQPPQVPHSA